MQHGVQVPPAVGVRRNVARDERGSVLVELVFSALVLVVFFFAVAGTAMMVRDYVHLQRVAREAAREAAMLGDVSAGYRKGTDLAGMYFPRGGVSLRLERRDAYRSHSVTAVASYPHRVFGGGVLGMPEVRLSAQATFGWWDTSTEYE